jgi:hypothetical protein
MTPQISRLAFVLGVCEADMSLTTMEKGTLVNLLLKLNPVDRRLFSDIGDSDAVPEESLELYGRIDELGSMITRLIEQEEYTGRARFRAQYCAELIKSDPEREQLLVIGLCFKVLRSDHQDNALSQMLEGKEIDCLEKVSELLGLTSSRTFSELLKLALEEFARRSC